MLGLFASAGVMLAVVARAWMRPHPGGRVEFSLGPPASGRSLGASLAAFVVAFTVLAGVAVAAERLVGHDGPLYVAFLLPWIVPVIFAAARWGLESGAPGKMVWDAGEITLVCGGSDEAIDSVCRVLAGRGGDLRCCPDRKRRCEWKDAGTGPDARVVGVPWALPRHRRRADLDGGPRADRRATVGLARRSQRDAPCVDSREPLERLGGPRRAIVPDEPRRPFRPPPLQLRLFPAGDSVGQRSSRRELRIERRRRRA